MTIPTKAPTLAHRSVVPSQASLATLNKLRAKHGVVSSSFSDVFAAPVNGAKAPAVYETIGQRALHIIGDSYRANSKLRWGSTLKEEQIYKIPNWRYVTDTGSVASRQKFAQAYQLIDACNFGRWGNAEFSDNTTISGRNGGTTNFPIYPADMRYMANGDKDLGLPGDGYDIALKNIRDALTDRSAYFDYLNAASYVLFNQGVVIDGKVVNGSYYMGTVIPSLMSDDYQAYLREVMETGSDDIKEAARFCYTAEINTIVLFNRVTATRVFIERQSANISSILSDVYHGKKQFNPEAEYDTTVMPYVLKRMQLALTSSSNSLVKSSAAALQIILGMLATDKTQVAGIKQNAAIANLFRIYSGDAHIGSATDVVMTAADVEGLAEAATAVGGQLTFTDGSTKAKFVEALKTLNASGLLGTVGFMLSFTRAVYDTLYLEAAVDQKKVTTPQVMGLISRYLGVYGGLGNCLKFFNTIKPTAKKAMLAAADALRFEDISAEIWGTSGTLATGVTLPETIGLEALDTAAAELARNFAELPFAQETSFIDTAFSTELKSVAGSVEGTAPATVESMVTASATEVAAEIERATGAAISSTSSLTALKVFGISTALAGLFADIIGLASSIIDLAQTANPKATQVLGLTSSIVGLSASTIGLGVAYGFLESAAFPPLAIGLGIGAIVIGLVSAIINLANSNEKVLDTRKKMTDALRLFESEGYLHDWGDAIQFLSCYYENTLDPAHNDRVTRWSPDDVAIFVDEKAAWQVFQQAKGTTQQRFVAAAPKLVHARVSGFNL